MIETLAVIIMNKLLESTNHTAGIRKVKPTWILLKQETVSGSGISWAICKSAPHPKQITTSAPHHSVFYRPDALPVAQPTASKHWRDRELIIQETYTYLRSNSNLFYLDKSCHIIVIKYQFSKNSVLKNLTNTTLTAIITLLPSRGVKYCNKCVCMSVYLSLLYLKSTRLNFTNFMCMLPITMAQSSFDDNAIHCILPVLHIMPT